MSVNKLLGMIAPIFLIVFSIFIILESIKMPGRGFGIAAIVTSPGFFPALLSIPLMLLALTLIYRSFRQDNVSTYSLNVFKSVEVRRWLILVLATALYIYLLDKFSFSILTFIYLLSILFFLNRSIGLIKIIITAFLASFIVGYLIPLVFNMPLPFR